MLSFTHSLIDSLYSDSPMYVLLNSHTVLNPTSISLVEMVLKPKSTKEKVHDGHPSNIINVTAPR